jgi:hypothetical protein
MTYIFLVVPALGASKNRTEELLQFLQEAGYKVSQKKAQICLEEVICLGYHLSQGKRRLGTGRKEVILQYLCPESQRQFLEFLGNAGFCHLWIPGFLVTAGPLYEAVKGNPIGPLHWGPDQEDTFQKLKQHKVRHLTLPDVTCPFHLYVHEKGGIGLGVLNQPLGPWNWPVAYPSKKLDPVASDWPPCLWALAVAVLLIQEADKLTLGQNIMLQVPTK